jgi:hypothetical protein
MKPRIAGAGLAGLLAAHAWPQAAVYDPQPEPRAHHRALLRFRTPAVSQLVGIEFRAVLVRKGIWYNSKYVAPDIQLANHYSAKCLGSIEADRSIWNIDPVERFIAPETLYEQLVEAVGDRIRWSTPCDYNDVSTGVISTAPLPVVLKELQIDTRLSFNRAPIHVARYRVPKCAVYQTVYFPHPEQPVYRASITGDLLIVESVAGQAPDTLHMNDVMEAFGIYSIDPIDTVEQRYGKIVPLPPGERKALLHQLTVQHGIFALGRFATWRNVLLDDVVNDIAVIRRLLRSSEYDLSLHYRNA